MKYRFLPVGKRFFSLMPKESSHFPPGSPAFAIGNDRSPIPTHAQINLLTIFLPPSNRLLLTKIALPAHYSCDLSQAGVYPFTLIVALFLLPGGTNSANHTAAMTTPS